MILISDVDGAKRSRRACGHRSREKASATPVIGSSGPYVVKGRQNPSMQSLAFSPEQTFTRLYARITQEDGAFTVSVRLLNHRKEREGAWGEEVATSIDMASAMIDSIAEQFRISQKCIAVTVVMDRFKDGTFH
jgi:hypothetical protein